MPGGDYRDALRDAGRLGARGRPALDADGERVGEHRGTAGYTVGQRQGLGVALGEPRYVSRIDPLTNTITLGRREDLETTTHRPRAGELRRRRRAARSGDRSGPSSGSATAPSRSRRLVRPATAHEPARGGRWLVETDTPVWAAAPGQAAVLYDGERRPRRRPDRAIGARRDGRARTTGPHRRRRRAGRLADMSIGPALILAVLVGIFHASLYVLIRGNAGGRLPILVVAAILGAWAGDALGARLGFDLLRIGDFHLLAASVVAWIGIAISSAVAILGPSMRKA